MKTLCVIGIDLAGVQHRPTGMCVLKGNRARTFLKYSNKEILECLKEEKPGIVAIDAPLSLPPGRKSIHDRNGEHFRDCDIELRKRKIKFFPITLGPMRVLTERGIALKNSIESMDLECIEIYPGGAQDLWKIPRARHSIPELRKGLLGMGVEGLGEDITDHELDAVTGALVGKLYIEGKAEVYGDISKGAIVMPMLK